MSYVMQVLLLATGEPSEHDGAFVADYEADVDSAGRARVTFTRDRSEAMQFETQRDAILFYRQVSHVKPKRDDGEPNCPLTAWTVSIE